MTRVISEELLRTMTTEEKETARAWIVRNRKKFKPLDATTEFIPHNQAFRMRERESPQSNEEGMLNKVLAEELLGHLKPGERKIIESWLEGHTLKEIGISSQKHKKIMLKLNREATKSEWILGKENVQPVLTGKEAMRETARQVIKEHFLNFGTSSSAKALLLMLEGKNWKTIVDECKIRKSKLAMMLYTPLRGELGKKLEDAGVPRSEWPELFGRAL